MDDAGPIERLCENATGVVSILVTGIFLGALFTGQDWWLPFMLVGYVMIVPIVALLFGDEEDIEEWWDDETITEPEHTQNQETDEQALETLRDRYARGELTDDQFERKVQRLLETESLEDLEDRQDSEREPIFDPE
ncbi:SHOCT domain-containing protein [Halorhabdus sp. CUG00001]|uniref:SHOCT domain-containing protein n=1 Tax=Halorhabdus sp. CUG00001 TaxID=2600297 RepID=UPI00131E798E|nr:SHOCT domain-containing protein [Halorhabdus sp. CUG00001]